MKKTWYAVKGRIGNKRGSIYGAVTEGLYKYIPWFFFFPSRSSVLIVLHTSQLNIEKSVFIFVLVSQAFLS